MEEIKIVTNIEDAAPVYQKIAELSNQKAKLSERYENLKTLKNFQKMDKVGAEINIIKNEIRLLRDSIEYVRIKAFILCAKSFLTKDQMQQIGINADNLLAQPELYILDSKN